jgi:hypothetical protein
LLTDAAKVLRISEDRIENVVPYNHQLWVHIKGVGGKFVSYRRLDIWIDAARSAIAQCNSEDELKDLGKIFFFESNKYAKYYDITILETLRDAWKKRLLEIKQKQREIELRQARQKEVQQWRSIWTDVVNHCENREFLKYTMSEIHRQKQQWKEFPDVIASVEKICLDRWKELTQIGVA